MTTATVRSMSGPRSTLQARIAECPHLPAFCTLELLNLASETPGWDGGIWSPRLPLPWPVSICCPQPPDVMRSRGGGTSESPGLQMYSGHPCQWCLLLPSSKGKAELSSGQQLGSAWSSTSWAWLLSSQHLPLESGEDWLNEWTAVGTGWACSLAVALLSGLGLALLERFSERDTEAQSRGGVFWSHTARPRWAPRPLISVLTSLCSFFFFLILKFLTSGITNQRTETNLKGGCFSFWNHSWFEILY